MIAVRDNPSSATNGSTALVLAGGKGTRVANLFPDLPKPLIPAANMPFLFWLISWLYAQGVRDYVFSCGHRGHQINAWLQQFVTRGDITLRCVQEDVPLGTGGAVRHCLPYCANSVLLLNGDTLLLADLGPLYSRFDSERLDGILFAKSVPDISRFGSLRITGGLVVEMAEKSGSGPGHVYGGVALFRRHVLESFPIGQPVSLETQIVPALIAGGSRIGAQVVEAPFLDIGTEATVCQGDIFVAEHRTHFCTNWTDPADVKAH